MKISRINTNVLQIAMIHKPIPIESRIIFGNNELVEEDIFTVELPSIMLDTCKINEIVLQKGILLFL